MVVNESNMETDQNDDKLDEEDIGISCSHDVFREVDEVNAIIDRIPMTVQSEVKTEKEFEDLKRILDEYQEQPHLLDSHLENLLGKLISIVRTPSQSIEVLNQTFKYLWLITKVRGYKTIVRKLPHEVKDLTPVLKLLENSEIQNDFFASYVLLMWLSIIVYMPFNMMGFDEMTKSSATTSENSNQRTVVERILIVIKQQLQTSNKSREMAAYLASRFVTRPDLRDVHLPQFLSYCFEILENCTTLKHHHLICNKLGVLRAMGLIFKHGKREELQSYSEDVLARLIKLQILKTDDVLLRKYSIKIIQRIGLSFLKPRLASWRYQMGSRSLTMNLNQEKMGSRQGQPTRFERAAADADEEEYDISGSMEDIVDSLLQGLKDKDSVVRWSSAKGIGRVTGRLPKDFADDVVGAILDLFNSRESDKAWHGGCLALAELARRSLLLPERLPVIFPIVEKALVYDEQRGQCSVGSNIRDSACYLCWAFARAYHPDQLKDYVAQLSTGLLIVSLFDREIPCRRAGSAAFQEHVGRQGSFPHGIAILTTVDYFAVGNRSNSYLKLSVEVGKYPQYTIPLIDHLVEKKINHWDSVIRDLAAKALHNLSHFAIDYMCKTVLPQLLQLATGTVLIARHGAILAIGHVVLGVATAVKEQGKSLQDYLDDNIVKEIRDIVPTLDEKKLYRGMGGEYMRQATSILIEKVALARLPYFNDDILGKWLSLLEECVVYAEENIRLASLEALPSLLTTYYLPLTDHNIDWRDNLIMRYTQNSSSEKEIISLGSSAALGCIPADLLTGKLDVVLSTLIKTTKITPTTTAWATGRKVAITSIMKIVDNVGINADGAGDSCINKDNIDLIYKALLEAMDDYTTDRRGDVGAWVREAAITALQKLTISISETDKTLFSEEYITEMMSRICQQSVERIDRTRKLAGSAFASFLHRNPSISYIPHQAEVEAIFTKTVLESINWASERSTLQYFVKLLDFPPYRIRLILGLTYSLGGVSANLSRYANGALVEYLNEKCQDTEALKSFLSTILDIFNNHHRVDRVILPLIRSIADLFSSCFALDSILESNEDMLSQLLASLKKECTKCSDYHKLIATTNVLCELLRIDTSLTNSILTQLSIFLGYQYPKVRSVTASSLLTALQDYCDKEIVPEDHLEEITSILEDTEWMNNLEEARSQRNKLCVLIGIPHPQAKKKT